MLISGEVLKCLSLFKDSHPEDGQEYIDTLDCRGSFMYYLVDPASSHMLVSKIKPCKSKYKLLKSETANSSLHQLWFLRSPVFYLDNPGKSRANT